MVLVSLARAGIPDWDSGEAIGQEKVWDRSPALCDFDYPWQRN